MMKVMILPHVTIIGIYRSPGIPVQQLYAALNEVLSICTSQFNIFIGDFNVNWLDETNRRPLYSFLLIIIIIDNWFLLSQQTIRH